MDGRHRGGDRYGGDDYDHNSRRPRRPSRFSDGPLPPPPSRFSDGPPPSRFSDASPTSRFSDGPPPPSRFSDGPYPPSRFSDGPPPPSRFSDGPPLPSRFSDAHPSASRFSDRPSPPNRHTNNGNSNNSGNNNYGRRTVSPVNDNYRGVGGGGGRRPFESPPGRSPGGGGGGFGPMGGGFGGEYDGMFRPMGGGGGFVPPPSIDFPPPFLPPPQQQHQQYQQQQTLSGQKRGFPYSGQGSSPDRFGGGGGSGGGSFVKLFVGSVPSTATEEDIRPMFEEHGRVIEVALIRDKRTGQQRGCCFVKYASPEEADMAIKALHNQRTIPGGVAPIQVRYADGERERLGAVEYKLFVGSMNKQATETEIEEIFAPYGQVIDVYLMRDEMKHSRGCGFVKYAQRDMALAAINALNGIYRMRGCDQPLSVRFADPKKPRAGDSGGGGPGFGPRYQAPGPRGHFGDTMGDQVPPNAWRPMNPQELRPPSYEVMRTSSNQLPPRFGETLMPLNQGGSFGGPTDGAFPGPIVPSAAQQTPSKPLQQGPPVSQQTSPLQKPQQSPQNIPPSLQLHGQDPSSYSQLQHSNANRPYTGQHSGQMLFNQMPPSQAQFQQHPTSNSNLQSHPTYQQQSPGPVQQQSLQSFQQPPSQLAQMMSQQTQNLQASLQSSQQAFSQLQQQVQMMQPPTQGLHQQQNLQPNKLQWPGNSSQLVGNAATTRPADSTAAPASPVKCNWTEHTSPEGFKYYYNSVTRESKWERPEELTAFEKQKPSVQLPQSQPNPQVLPIQQQPQPMQQYQLQFHQQQHQPSFPSQYAASGGRIQQDSQGRQAPQDWMWKSNKPGT